jgi:OOP family OmpA-OmpF porin
MKIRLALLALALSAGLHAQGANGGPAYVFFDWGKTELSTDATATLDTVAQAYAQSPRPLVLDGHSDRSGPDGANLRSSRHRAEIARVYLVAHGVPGGAITVRAYGESRPIIATADGVREIQNRRVEIRFAN